MKSGLDMTQDIFNVVDVDDVSTVITGNVYMYERPKNSDKEDVVVNCIAINGEQLQQGTGNVNIHAPNLKLKIAGKNDDTQPDIEKLQLMTNLILPKIKDVVGPDYHFHASAPGQPTRDVDNSWYVNIRLTYYAVQQNFTNI